MRPRTWKLLGVAGLAGVTATGVVVARRRRAQTDYDPDELRARLHDRLAQVPREGGGPPAAPPGAAPPGDAPPGAEDPAP
jgi:hypothetical protein